MIDSDKERAAFIEEATELLHDYWLNNPNLRLGQIVVNVANVLQQPPYEMTDGGFFFGLGMVEGRRLRPPE